MSISLNIAAVNTKSKVAGQSRGDLIPLASPKQSSSQMSKVMADRPSLNSGLNVSDTGKANPFSNVLKKQLLSQTSADADETLLSGQEQKAKIKSLLAQQAKTKDTKTSDNAAELAGAMAVLPPLPQVQTDISINLQTASRMKPTGAPLNSQVQQQSNLKQSLGTSRQGERQSEQALKTTSQAAPSLQATVKKNIVETAPEVKTEPVVAEKKTIPQIEIKEIPKSFQPRVAQNQTDQSNAVQPVVSSQTKAPPTQFLTQVQVPVQAQVQAQAQVEPQFQPQTQQTQVKQIGSSLARPPISSKESPQGVTKKEELGKKTVLPDKIVSGESFQSAIVSQQSQQGIAETTSQAAEKTSVISIDSAGRQETLKPADQILQHIPTTMTGSFQQIRMTLAPEELGSIRIVFRQQDEQIYGVIEVEKSSVQKDIEKAMPQIASAMADSGIQLRRIEVIPMQNNPNSPNNQFSQDFNPSDQRHPTGQTTDQSSRGGISKNASGQGAESVEDEISSKPQQVFDNSGLNMYA